MNAPLMGGTKDHLQDLGAWHVLFGGITSRLDLRYELEGARSKDLV